ncbi:MAG: HNH endonuclease [Planctomycetaceae bacterium]
MDVIVAAEGAISPFFEKGLPMSTRVLDRPTLVLNRNWQPVGVATVARSLVKVWNQTATIVDPADYQQYSWADWARLIPRDEELAIQTGTHRLRVPEVIVLSRYDRLPVKVVTFTRRNLFRRDHSTCQYCGQQPGIRELTIDHVLPRAQGGLSTWDNCVLACTNCNARKANQTPEQARMPLRRLPERPAWKPLYDQHTVRIDSWQRFLSEAYWSVPLAE